MRLGWLLLCLWAGTALADDLPQVGVLDLQANGASPQLAAALGGVVSNELQGLQVFRVTSSDNVRHLLAIERQRQLLGCPNESCVSSVTSALGFQYVLTGKVSRVEGRGSTPAQFGLTMTLLDSRTGAQVGSVVENAPSEAELVSGVHNSVLTLVGKVLKGRTGSLVVNVSEAGAAVKVDDTLLGVTPLGGRLMLAAGPHLLTVEKKGFVTSQKQVRIAPDQLEEEQVTLTPSPDFIKDYEASASRMRIGAWTASTVALVGLAAGAYFQLHASSLYGGADQPGTFAFDRAKLQAGIESEGTTDYRQSSTDLKAKIQTAQVISLAALGAAAVGGGLATYFWVAGDAPHRYDRYQVATPQVAVVPTSGGAMASASWQF